MTETGSYLVGIHPRPEPLIEATRAYDRKRLDAARLEELFDKERRSLIEAQADAGLTYLIDGLLNWQDLLRPFTESLDGLETGALTRWFDNNTFYRKPVVKTRVAWTNPVLSGRYIRRELFPPDTAVKAVLPAPFTFTRLSENTYYRNWRELLHDVADALNREAKSLQSLGVSCIQFSDPSLAFPYPREPISRDEVELARESVEIAVSGLRLKTCLHTYFGDASRILPWILDFPVDMVGVDFFETSLERIGEYSFTRELGCGCVDGRNSMVEPVEEIVDFIRKAADELSPPRIYVSPNSEMEYLPHQVAQKKLVNIGKASKKFTGTP